METLAKYERVSGQKINKDKSAVYLHQSVTQTVVNRVVEETNIPRKEFLFTYLGVPIYYGRRRIAHFKEITDKIQNRLSLWTGKQLSIAGRATLINHVLQNMPIYLLSACDPSAGVLAQIHRLFAKFIWSNSVGNSNKHWTSWTTLCHPRSKEEQKWGIQFASRCSCCQSPQEETIAHAFLNSNVAQELPESQHIKMIYQIITAVIVWELWKRRNTLQHGGTMSVNKVKYKITHNVILFMMTRRRNFKYATYNWNTNGDLIYDQSHKINDGNYSNTQAEAEAILQALKYMKKKMHIPQMIVETDSMLMKNVIEGEVAESLANRQYNGGNLEYHGRKKCYD
ncbi:uncharacterized protein [Nicotiana tomentosiformis]|uniref:uncharacterized protein n=1 Tax=Nicotiana tomentosiformis TaxID=4098 RepID=UPI00051BAADB|nr:uncharacterized protein LOC117281524 [Nicotiana tomentosiformis]